jgi:PAS domain S-box-containing protein
VTLWPAVWVGAFVANAGLDVPLWTAGAVATGNTLEAVMALWLLRRSGFDTRLQRIRDVLLFTALGAAISTTVSATVGVASLAAAGEQPWAQFAPLWRDWWLGDAVGALVVAPVILTLAPRRTWSWKALLEIVALAGGATATLYVVFGVGPTAEYHPLAYLIFPFVIAAAVRGKQPATSVVVLAASAVTISRTVQGVGPFSGPEVHDGLILLQGFMAVLGGTGLLLAAAIAERETGERRRAAAHAVANVLARAQSFESAAPELLRNIGETLEWQIGAVWLLNHGDRRLYCTAYWNAPGMFSEAFERATRELRFPRGVGLPGRVLANRSPAWIEDVVGDSNFPRAPMARAAGVHGGFGFPILLGEDVLGVVEFFNRTIVPPDAGLLQTMATVGNQVGQFIGRKQQEDAVSEEQRRTLSIVNTALDAVIGMDHKGIITEFNPAAVRIFGYSREAAIGRDLVNLVVPPALRDRYRAGLARYLQTGEGPFLDQRIETVAYHADGHEFPVEVAIARISDDEPPAFTGFVRDLTARMQGEREREELLAREAAARAEAEAANRAKDEFLATLSHELRTPLNAIVGWTRLLLDGKIDAASSRRALEVIDRNAQLQTQLVADILDVSRIITGGLRLESRPVDLDSVVGSALDAVRPAADARRVRLRTRLAPSARLVEGDPQRLQQVVWNLVSNAVKFTDEGGTVTVELLDAGAAGVRLRVHDDGAGIDPAFLPHVFERFRQGDGSISRQHGGLGLGLAIVRHLVELHGGSVHAESAGSGRGSTFTVELKRIIVDPPTLGAARSHLTADPRPGAGCPLEGYRLLCVDDQPDARDLISMILIGAGADVETAASAGDALTRLAEAKPHAILADIGMPGADGYTLIREVRRLDAQAGTHLPAAAVTAYVGDGDRARVIAAGFDCHVPKPVSRQALIAAVLSMCRDVSAPRQRR